MGLQVVVRVELCYCVVPIQHYSHSQIFNSFQVPVLVEGQHNVTELDLQLKTLRDAAVGGIREMANRMRKEATDVKATVGDIEDWLDRIKQLAEEVRKCQKYNLMELKNTSKT